MEASIASMKTFMEDMEAMEDSIEASMEAMKVKHCTDRAQTSGNVTLTVKLCPPHPTFRTKVRARRDLSEENQNDIYTYTYNVTSNLS